MAIFTEQVSERPETIKVAIAFQYRTYQRNDLLPRNALLRHAAASGAAGFVPPRRDPPVIAGPR
jgi:hypothetical protein